MPATSPRFLEKAAQGPADAVFIDLEDAVAPSLKVKARAEAIAALNQVDWGRRIVAVRVNGFATPWGCRDILDVVEAVRGWIISCCRNAKRRETYTRSRS